MLTSITIDGLRGIAHGELKDLAPLNVIVGTNGAGKSTILDAINIVANPFTTEAISVATKRRQLPLDYLRWLMPKGDTNSSAKVMARNSDQSCLVTLKCDEAQHIYCAGEVSRSDDSKELTWSGTVYTSGHGHQNAGSAHLGVRNVRLIDSHGKDVLRPIHTLQSLAIQSGLRAEVRALIQSILPEVDDILIQSDDKDRPVAHVAYATHSVPVSLVGDGIEVVIRLALELLLLDDGLLLLEEPEVHLHPAALRQAARVIMEGVRRGVQVILTTHSLELIDRLVAELEETELSLLALFQVRLQHGQLKVARIPGDEVAFMRGQIEDDLR